MRLRILATTDLHARLLPFDYYNDRPRPATGLAQAGTLIRALRDDGPGGTALLLDNGDLLQGGLLSDLLAGEEGPNPVIAGMTALGYDAATLGNHDFDHGLPFLRAALADATFPVVSANLLLTGGAHLVPPWTILDRTAAGPDGTLHPVRVGILGLGPPQGDGWAAKATLVTRDILATAREEIPRLRAAGAEIVVALCHSGLGNGSSEPMQENAALALAALPGLDALVIGHSHEVFPLVREGLPPGVDPVAGTLHGRPAVQPGFFGSHVGLIDLHLRREAGRWRPVAHEVRAIPVPADTPPDPAVAAPVAVRHDRLRARAASMVGATRVPLHSYFAVLGSDPSLDVVADAKRREAQRLLKGRPEASLPLLCTVTPSRAGGRAGPDNYVDILPGPIAFRQAAALYAYPNTFCLLEITGRGLRDWLERSAALFRTLVPGAADQPLLDPSMAYFHFDTIDGLTWVLDPSLPPRTDPTGRVLDPAARRILDLRHDGRPVADSDRFVLATSSHRLRRLGRDVEPGAARLVHQSLRSTREIVLAHIRAMSPLDPAPRPRWHFAALPGTSVWFDSGPGALAHLAALRDRRVEDMGPAPGGFRRFRLHL